MQARGIWFGTFLFLSGCSAVAPVLVTVPSKRVALSPAAWAPPSLRGSPGLGLATRIALAAPSAGADGAGVAVPAFQPEVNGVFKFAEHAYGSFDLLFAPGENSKTARPDLPRVASTLAFGALLGLGYDFRILRLGGINFSAEGGLTYVALTTTIAISAPAERGVLLPAGRLAASPYFELDDVRVFAAVAVGTDIWSEPDGTVTTCAGCPFVDSGRTEARGMIMVGGGLRYRALKKVSVSVELWVPVTTSGIRHAPQVTLAAQVGPFDFSPSQWRRPPPPAEPPLPPPPLSQPATAPQLHQL